MTQRLVLDEIVDPFGARVVVERDPDGHVLAARFDLTGLPRIDSLLAGQLVADVPGLVERLCGICPAAHHLAGMRALEALSGAFELPPTAVAVRRLLHHASIVTTHAVRLLATARDDALLLRALAKNVTAAVGSPGHFPVTAVPGGVIAAVSASDRDRCAALAAPAVDAALRAARQLVRTGSGSARFSGADVALADADGNPDLLGVRLRAVAADGSVLVANAPFSELDQVLKEALPGQPAPRPYLVALGPERGGYRVGPTAQLRVGTLGTPLAAMLQDHWLRSGGDAAGARAVITLHAMEVIADLLSAGQAVIGESRVAVTPPSAGVGVGVVDGPRGLLIHRYLSGADGRLEKAVILTPTAQNEFWLAELLGQAAATAQLDGLEQAIRDADPCLPCSSAPAGAMGLQVDDAPAEGGN